MSVFARRLADAGIDYRPIRHDAVERARKTSNVEISWASTREVFNVIEANEMGCHIVTAPIDRCTRSARRSASDSISCGATAGELLEPM